MREKERVTRMQTRARTRQEGKTYIDCVEIYLLQKGSRR